MMEKDIIKTIQGLKQIKPSKEWVVLTKKQVLGEMPGYRERFIEVLETLPKVLVQSKLAYATVTLFLIFIGLFGFTQNTVPGDFLFTIKKVAEQTQGIFIPEKGQSKYNLEIVNKRLQDLTKVAIDNQTNKIIPAINELQASVSDAANSLNNEEIKRDPQAIKEIAQEVKKIEENKQRVESFGIVIGENNELGELNNALSQMVQKQISELEKSSLTEVQQTLLAWAKIDFNDKNYSEALIKIWQISNK